MKSKRNLGTVKQEDRYKIARGWLYSLIIRASLPLKMPRGYCKGRVSSVNE